jgi:glycosyltransferase involved in cell wall biosynthesis
MSIYFIIPSIKIGGTEKYLIKLSNFLFANNWKVTVLVLTRSISCQQRNRFYPGVKIIVYPGRVFSIFRLRRFLLNSIGQEPAIVYGLLDLGNLALIVLPRRQNFVKITSIRYSMKRLKFRIIRKLLISISILMSENLITNSNSTQIGRFLRRFTATFSIPNGVEMPEVALQVNPSSENKVKINILVVGNLRREKGLIYLLRALAQLSSKQKEFFSVKIVGEGKERETLSKFLLLQELDVSLEGAQAVDPYYRWADIYIQPSITEGFSNSILEAMSYGLPVFASNTGAAREILEKDEVIFEPKNVVEIQRILLQIYYGEIDLRVLSVHNRTKVLNSYQMEECLNLHLGIFHRAIQKLN